MCKKNQPFERFSVTDNDVVSSPPDSAPEACETFVEAGILFVNL